MRECFVPKNFSASSMAIIRLSSEICQNYARQGYDLSLRQLYYQLVTRNTLANTEQNYKRLGNIVSDARLAGLMDWEWIKDRGRETITNNHWENPGQIIEAAAQQYRVDTREGQDTYIEVMVEKQALEGILVPACRDLDVSFTANKGYSSSSAMYETGKRIARKMEEGYREAVVIYLGDHDPSGIDMSRDVQERLSQFAQTPVTVVRVALNMDQIEKYNPPENPTKLTDSRAESYIQKFGHSCWELDALEPRVLVELVTDEVNHWTDGKLLEEREKVQNKHRDSLMKFAHEWEQQE